MKKKGSAAWGGVFLVATAFQGIAGAGDQKVDGQENKRSGEKKTQAEQKPDPAATAAAIGFIHENNQLAQKGGALAAKRGQAEAVRALGREMVTDHRDADQALFALLSQEEQAAELLKTAVDRPPDHEETLKAANQLEAIRKVAANAFDAAFLAWAERLHERGTNKLTECVLPPLPKNLERLCAAIREVEWAHLAMTRELSDEIAANNEPIAQKGDDDGEDDQADGNGIGETVPITDDAILNEVQGNLFLGKLDGVRVSIENGAVTLTGTVPDENAHRRALALAKNTTGVVRIVDQLQIKAP